MNTVNHVVVDHAYLINNSLCSPCSSCEPDETFTFCKKEDVRSVVSFWISLIFRSYSTLQSINQSLKSNDICLCESTLLVTVYVYDLTVQQWALIWVLWFWCQVINKKAKYRLSKTLTNSQHCVFIPVGKKCMHCCIVLSNNTHIYWLIVWCLTRTLAVFQSVWFYTILSPPHYVSVSLTNCSLLLLKK